MELKQQIIDMVDEIDDPGILEQVYQILNSITTEEGGEIWNNLSDNRKSKVFSCMYFIEWIKVRLLKRNTQKILLFDFIMK